MLLLDEPLSFWGGLDPETGLIVDAHHPQRGAGVTGKILVMPAGRGSSSSSSVLAEALRAGRGPAAVVLRRADPIVVLGALVARELYGTACPVVALGERYDSLMPGVEVEVDAETPAARVRELPASDRPPAGP